MQKKNNNIAASLHDKSHENAFLPLLATLLNACSLTTTTFECENIKHFIDKNMPVKFAQFSTSPLR